MFLFTGVDLKNSHNLKWKVMFYSVGIFRISRLRDSISSNPERTAPRRWRWGGQVRLYRSLQQRAGSLNIKWLLLVKENQISQVEEFRAFLCMGTEIIPFICISAVWGQYPLFFTSHHLLSAHSREWLQPDSYQIAGIILPRCPPGSEIHIWRARISDGCDILVFTMWQEMLHFPLVFSQQQHLRVQIFGSGLETLGLT